MVTNGNATAPIPFAPRLTADLVLEARNGSRTAREELLVRSLPRLRLSMRRRLPSRSRGHMDTSDLSQDAALLALAHLGQFTPEHPGSMSAFLRRIATNRVHDELRRTFRRPESVELDERLPSGGPSPLELTAREEQRRRCRRALEKLSSRDRHVLLARVEGNCSLAMLALQFGLPSAGAAGMAVHRAKHRLRRELDT